MKYWELIKTTKMLSPVTVVQPSSVNTTYTAPPGYDETILGDEEVNEVLSMLMEFKEKYFSEIPLSDTLEQRFVWNLPMSIYKAAINSKNKGEPDCVNPLYWFYLFCVEDPGFAVGKFMITAVNIMTDDEYAVLEKYAEDYDEYNRKDDLND